MTRQRVSFRLVALALLASAGYVHAQWGGFREGRYAARFAPPELRAANFTFCRLMYTSVRSEPMGMGWRTDYPYAEINLMTRLSELTKAPVNVDEERNPNHYVVRLTDDALFSCPFVMASDAGTMGLSDEEAAGLRKYLLKGGFLWVDDFWGTPAWDHWEAEIAKVLPRHEYKIVDVPLTDPIFRTMFHITKMPQITNIQFWRRVGGSTTSERGFDSEDVRLRAIRDARGRVMVLMTHNNDVADSWEREGEDPGFFYQFSPDGYALGINVLLYAMSH
jgi:hypothetical protein